MAVDKSITYRTERLPEVFRREIYELDDMAYTITYDDLTGERMLGEVTMYKGIRVCLVGADGVISMNMPTGWVTSHKEMVLLAEDVKRLDAFISAVCKEYK